MIPPSLQDEKYFPPNQTLCVRLISNCPFGQKKLLRLQLREQDYVADAFLAEEHHAQAVNPDADAAGGRHAVFERDEEILVQLLLLAAGLMLQRGALCDGIVLLGVAGGNFLAVDAALENLDGRRGVGRKLGERHEFLGQMRDERGLDQSRLDQFFKHRASDE